MMAMHSREQSDLLFVVIYERMIGMYMAYIIGSLGRTASCAVASLACMYVLMISRERIIS